MSRPIPVPKPAEKPPREDELEASQITSKTKIRIFPFYPKNWKSFSDCVTALPAPPTKKNGPYRTPPEICQSCSSKATWTLCLTKGRIKLCPECLENIVVLTRKPTLSEEIGHFLANIFPL